MARQRRPGGAKRCHSPTRATAFTLSSARSNAKNVSPATSDPSSRLMAGIAHNQGFESMMIGGVSDHVHALLVLPPTLSLSKAVQFLKGSSSKWINETTGESAWEEGLGGSASAHPRLPMSCTTFKTSMHITRRKVSKRNLSSSSGSTGCLTNRRTSSDVCAVPPGLALRRLAHPALGSAGLNCFVPLGF